MTDQQTMPEVTGRPALKWTEAMERRALRLGLAVCALTATGALVVIAVRLGEIERSLAYLPGESAVQAVADSVSGVGSTLEKMEAKQPEPVVSVSRPWLPPTAQDPVAAAIDRQTRAQEQAAQRQRMSELLDGR